VNLARLTAAKAVANTALRWAPPFLPVLERAFGASTAQMTTVLGAGEMAGLSTIAVGRFLDRGRERIVMSIALVAIAVASLISLVGTTFSFAIGFVLVVIGVSNCTVSGHSHISHRVPYAQRARAIGLYETSWALALLIGAPIIAGLIAIFGWRGPYVMLAAVSTAAAVMIWTSHDDPAPPSTSVIADTSEIAHRPAVDVASSPRSGLRTLDIRAWAVVAGSAGLAVSGLSVFAVSGAWLDDAFGVSTGGLGAVAMGFGALELLGSTASAALADRLGKLRGTLAGIVVLLAGLGVMSIADDSLMIGVVGILLFLCGFEFGFVTSLSLVTEAMPEARGTTIAVSSGVGTVARGAATIASGALFTAHGIAGTLVLSCSGALLAASAFALSRRARA
jgi:predicted MFS family arabinose efflux permease